MKSAGRVTVLATSLALVDVELILIGPMAGTTPAWLVINPGFP
jgi:hypothetical protein